MIKSLSFASKFHYQPHLNLRYFAVNYLMQDSFKGKYENIQETHQKYLQAYEDNGHLIFGSFKKENSDVFMIFHTKDERIPFDYIQNDPLFLDKLVLSYSLKEIELHSRGQSTELSQLYQYR